MYYANYIVNYGTRLMEPIKSDSLNAIRKEIKSLASGEIFLNSTGRITISQDVPVNDERGTTVEIVEFYEAKWCGGKVGWFKKL